MAKETHSVLVTGAAGFIGYHLCEKLLAEGKTLIGLDNLNAYYDPQLKRDRLAQLGITTAAPGEMCTSSIHGEACRFVELDLCDKDALKVVFRDFAIDEVCNLAAQAGVRYSLEHPDAYVNSNLVGFVNLLECMRDAAIPRLVYASSSSVYGLNEKTPFSTADNVDQPVSLYAATKKSNELLAYTYAHLFGIKMVGLRFFTVYGPWGRPDMAMFLFTDAIAKNKPIKIFNRGRLSRDFTYIDDIVAGVYKIMQSPPDASYSLYNIGHGQPVPLMDFIRAIEAELGREAKKDMLPMQPGDVEQTWADTAPLQRDYNFTPTTDIQTGVGAFIRWYKNYYGTVS